MTLILVEHDRAEPALYGAMAAVVARARGAKVMHLSAQFDTTSLEVTQHVTADGSLVPSGLIWVERIAGVPIGGAATPELIVARARDEKIVIPIMPGPTAQAAQRAALLSAAADAGIAVEDIRVERTNGQFCLTNARSGERLGDTVWTQDRFGRFEVGGGSVADGGVRRRVTVTVVGASADHHGANPATLAALGDAADAAGITLDVIFAAPADIGPESAATMARSAGGIVLPGGSNMANVPAQVMVAHEALRHGTPTVGLCLGMQTMTTAVVRDVLGRHDANLAEVDPDVAVKTFVPLGAGRHRLGRQTIVTSPESRLRQLLGAEATIRSNHRYKLNPDLVDALDSAGFAVTARDMSGTIAEGVELNNHPFFIGMQGHPELTSRQGAPHPLLTAFLTAASTRAH